jgi:prepilin-type N-terminal cleavage/methylation domain-containing protein
MLQKIQKRKEGGFTIIEVLIVLAIAGLIMLVVFLAVPALQRNSRNTQRKNDVSNLLGAVSEYVNNNGGALPPDNAAVTPLTKLGYFQTSEVQTMVSGAQGVIGTTNDGVRLVKGAKCSTSTTGATVVGSTRQIAAQYTYETNSGLAPGCQDS